MITMNRVLGISLLSCGLSGCGITQHDQSASPNGTKGTQPSRTADYPAPKVGDALAGEKVLSVETVQAAETTKDKTREGLPAPHARYKKAVSLKTGNPDNVWVFQPEGENDGSLVCIEDTFHCIGLLKLREQLNRTASDPPGLP